MLIHSQTRWNRSASGSQSRRFGFTLIEMLVVIAIIGLLSSMLLPAIISAREAARSAACISHLKNFGLVLKTRAAQDPSGAFCSGSFDFKRDGVPTEIGWVADVVKRKTIAGDMRCPSNPATTSKAIEELISAPISDFANSTCYDRLGSKAYQAEAGNTVENVARAIANGGYAPSSKERLELIYSKVIDQGYNTNYAATWFLTRTEFRLDGSGNIAAEDVSCTDMDPRGRNVTRGPLKSSFLDASQVPSSAIPLLCDAAATGFVSATIGEDELNSVAGGSMYVTPIVGVPIGNREKIDTNLDGTPDTSSTFFLSTPSFAAGTQRTGPSGWSKVWNFDTRQDYRAIQPVHNGTANVLMADGHVQAFYDQNGDGFINNGFDAPSTGQIYWRGGDKEVEESQMATFYSLTSKGPVL